MRQWYRRQLDDDPVSEEAVSGREDALFERISRATQDSLKAAQEAQNLVQEFGELRRQVRAAQRG